MPMPKSAELFFGLKLTDEQRAVADSIFDNQLTFINAPAGTGKTTIAVGCAKLLRKPLNYVFAPVNEKALGYLPGDLKDKERVYLTPLYDALEAIGENIHTSIFDERLSEQLNRAAWVNTKSHVYLRGSNFNHSITTIIDEAQNFTKAELRKVLTRAKEGKVIVIGNMRQCDINPALSGFEPYMNHLGKKEYARVLQLTHNFRGQIAKDADEI
jgi:phosphate starvation-inducible protein PhoH